MAAAGESTVIEGFRPRSEVLKLVGSVRAHAQVGFVETPGLATLEAVAAGSSAVVATSPVVKEYLPEGVWRVDPTSVTSVASGLESATTTPPKPDLAEMVRSTYDWSVVLQPLAARRRVGVVTTPIVEVLLSTFNAGEYLRPLLESVLSQMDVDVRLHVRDDGSTDGTREAVAELVGQGQVAVDLGSHIGPWRSYFELLTMAGLEGSFVAFCDQDDLWLPGKLSRAVRFLEGSARRPSMYCGRLTVTDVKLNAVGLSPLPRRPLSISNALVENVALGPTIVINARGRDLITKELPSYAVMHDAWVILGILCARQHSV